MEYRLAEVPGQWEMCPGTATELQLSVLKSPGRCRAEAGLARTSANERRGGPSIASHSSIGVRECADKTCYHSGEPGSAASRFPFGRCFPHIWPFLLTNYSFAVLVSGRIKGVESPVITGGEVLGWG